MSDVSLLSETKDQGVQTLEPPTIATEGFSGTRIARMQAALRRHVESGLLPGFAALTETEDAEEDGASGS